MIDPILWTKESPFVRNSVSPLKLTFHSSSFLKISPAESEALRILFEFSNLKEIDAIATESCDMPYIKMGSCTGAEPLLHVEIEWKDGSITSTAILEPAMLAHVAERILGSDKVALKTTWRELLEASAHHELQHDIFITCSPVLLANRTNNLLHKFNIRSPLETAKIMGLLLRFRDDYVWKVKGKSTFRYDRGLFYWVLTRHLLPNMWRYFSACVTASKSRGDDILELGQSILVRCTRAFEARDSIGALFYVSQNNNVKDATMYHFDYLTLLLTGAIDAQARVALRAYNADWDEWRAGFRKSKFVEALSKAGAAELVAFVSSQRSKDFMSILYELRNTIHGAALQSMVYIGGSRPQRYFAQVASENCDQLKQAAERLGGLDEWGIRKTANFAFDTYSFSVNLVKECMHFIDAIAAHTDVAKLSTDIDATNLVDGPPKDDIFDESRRKRIEILG